MTKISFTSSIPMRGNLIMIHFPRTGMALGLLPFTSSVDFIENDVTYLASKRRKDI